MKKYIHVAIGTVFLFSTSRAQVNSDNNAATNFSKDIVVVTEDVSVKPERDFPVMLLGVRLMPTVSNIKVQNSDGNSVNGEAVLSFGYGGLLGYNFTKHIGLQLEVLYTTLSRKYPDHTLNREIDIHYVNIPLLLSLNVNRTSAVNLNVVVGPQLGVNVGSSVSTQGTANGNSNTTAVLAVKENDFGVAYGAGLDFGLNATRTIRFDIGFRGVNGLIDISDRDKTLETDSYYILQKKRTQSYAGYIGFTFLL
ncbi:MAG: PorT family protein [Bacteroidetes bacterium]|nr:PorT family protein [Bacteroidota bacterium]